MHVQVEMHAFANGILRSVNVPNLDIIDAARNVGVGVDAMIESVGDRLGLEGAARVLAERLVGSHDAVRLALCKLAFHWGQNDFQAMHMPSVSVGDVIRIKTVDVHGDETSYRRFAVMPIGFREIEKDFDVPHNGGMWTYEL